MSAVATPPTESPTEQYARRAVEEIFDIYAQLDRLDEEALRKEMEGGSVDELVYEVDGRNGKEFRLSKVGVDECCTQMTAFGQCIREESLAVAYEGEGEDRVAVFTAVAARYAVSKDGSAEGKLDQLFGVKRQPQYDEAMPEMTLDSKMGFGKHGKLTWREVLATERGYLDWVANKDGMDERKKQFAQKCLNGEDVIMQGGRRFNPHWYEHGAMKALRNARIRLIPRHVREAVIGMAKDGGKVRRVEAPGKAQAPSNAASTRNGGATSATSSATSTNSVSNSGNGSATEPLRLPGKPGKEWYGHAGKLLAEVAADVLAKARDFYREKNAQRNAVLIAAIEAEIKARMEKDYTKDTPAPRLNLEEPPPALAEAEEINNEDDDLPF